MNNAAIPSDTSAFENLLAEIASRFAALRPDEFDDTVTTTLGRVGKFLGVDRCFIFILSNDGTHHRVAHVWTDSGIPQDDVVIGTLVQEGFPWVGDRMLGREDIVINRLDDLPPERGTNPEASGATGS